MIIIQMEGGLGNQMFQYALYLFFRHRNITAKADISRFENYTLHNGYELERIFGINAKYAGKKERAVVKVLGKCLHLLARQPYKEKARMQWRFQPAVHKMKFGFLKGYWQTEQYFLEAATLVRERFTFPAIADEQNKKLLQRFEQGNAVSLHVRRGDYLSIAQPATLPLAYYNEAIRLITATVPDARFFVFSDDIPWVKQNLHQSNMYYIDWNKGSESFRDMQLMSACQHNIIANSSFSWWGAWLNNNEKKIVIAPQQWMPGLPAGTDVLPKSWVQVPVTYEAANN
ncbi:MAG: alpha-1,2-fucosyltransferase [Chitinophagaceae bacterium]|nr:MAG: alpha-1,2-fucosyltransferase [Chitinophagaceae bacterium]